LARSDFEVTGLRRTAPFGAGAPSFGGMSCLKNDLSLSKNNNNTVVVRVTVIVRRIITPRITLVPQVVSEVINQWRVATGKSKIAERERLSLLITGRHCRRVVRRRQSLIMTVCRRKKIKNLHSLEKVFAADELEHGRR
jgi:hypothetical protein